MIEIKFLVPIREDRYVGNGRLHPYTRWKWLESELYVRFEALSNPQELIKGVYKDPDTGEKVPDESREYRVAIDKKKLKGMDKFLKKVAKEFRQKSLYVSIAKAYFVKRRVKYDKQKKTKAK